MHSCRRAHRALLKDGASPNLGGLTWKVFVNILVRALLKDGAAHKVGLLTWKGPEPAHDLQPLAQLLHDLAVQDSLGRWGVSVFLLGGGRVPCPPYLPCAIVALVVY